MFGSGEKAPLIGGSGDKAQKAVNNLSSALGGSDVENPYMSKAAPSGGASTLDRVKRELRTNWWLWGSIAFAVLLVGSLLVFRESLYDRAKHGLPFLAVKEYAADSCAAECKDVQVQALEKLQPNDADGEAKLKEQYDMCYTKCVAQETDKVVEERAQFKKTEEELEKVVEAKTAEAGTTGEAAAVGEAGAAAAAAGTATVASG